MNRRTDGRTDTLSPRTIFCFTTTKTLPHDQLFRYCVITYANESLNHAHVHRVIQFASCLFGQLTGFSEYHIAFLDCSSTSLYFTCFLFLSFSYFSLPPSVLLSVFFALPLFLRLGHCFAPWGHPSSRRKCLRGHDDKSCQVSRLNFILGSILPFVQSQQQQLSVHCEAYKIQKFRCFGKCR